MESRSYLPPEWANEERLRVLLGAMPGPQDKVARTARVTFWVAALHHWATTTHTLSFTLQDAMAAFRHGAQQPLCLKEVLIHMNDTGEVVPASDLPLGERPQESWLGWGHRVLVAGPSRLAWTTLRKAVLGDKIDGVTFVDTLTLQDMCDKMTRKYWETSADDYRCNMPVALPRLYKVMAGVVGSADNLHLVVETLAYDGRAATATHNGTTFVKFAMPGDTEKPVITLADLAENSLAATQGEVEASISKMTADIARLQSEAKDALRAGSKTQALSCLRRKKRIEKTLDTQLAALENVTLCLHQLQEAKMNRQVIGAFRSGVEAVKAAMAGSGSAYNVANTMDDLQEVLEDCQEISAMLGGGVKSQDDLDEDSLQQELADLLQPKEAAAEVDEVEEDLAAKMAGLVLPNVPRNDPLSDLRNESLSSLTATP